MDGLENFNKNHHNYHLHPLSHCDDNDKIIDNDEKMTINMILMIIMLIPMIIMMILMIMMTK